MSNGRRRAKVVTAMAALSVAMFVVGGLGLAGRTRSASPPPAASGGGPVGAAPGGDAVGRSIVALQARVKRVPQDYLAWASLGLGYVQQARITADPAYYGKAQAVLERSWSINTADNFAAAAGNAALSAARHDFSAAADWARRGLAVNPSSSTLWGALADAEVQRGRYTEAFQATQRMVDLSPDTASLARVSYVWELRGNTEEAQSNMTRALEAAFTPADRAFARQQLGELAFNSGNPAGALAQYESGLAVDPSYAALMAGKAKAEAALGHTDEAIVDYRSAIQRVPQPAYAIELGELYESLGRPDDARAQYALFGVIQKLFEANGVAADVDPTLFEANHGDPLNSVRYGEAAIGGRGIVDMADALGWALHSAGRNAEAAVWSDKALSLGTRNALFQYHAGMIKMALGDSSAARLHLSSALQINPTFSPLWAPKARQVLDSLGGSS